MYVCTYICAHVFLYTYDIHINLRSLCRNKKVGMSGFEPSIFHTGAHWMSYLADDEYLWYSLCL